MKSENILKKCEKEIKIINKIFKLLVISICILTIILVTQSAKADSILEIDIPMLGTTYDIATHEFKISGHTDVEVKYITDDGTLQESFVTYPYADFLLTTEGMDWEILDDGTIIRYEATTDTGIILLQESDPLNHTTLLWAELNYLEMTIVDPVADEYEGLGDFSILGGTLADDFGHNVGHANVELAFHVPLDFYNSFTSMADTMLFPDVGAPSEVSPSPEPSTLILFGSLLIGIGWIVKKQKVIKE